MKAIAMFCETMLRVGRYGIGEANHEGRGGEDDNSINGGRRTTLGNYDMVGE